MGGRPAVTQKELSGAGGASLRRERPPMICRPFRSLKTWAAHLSATHPIRTQYYKVLLTSDNACIILRYVCHKTHALLPNRDPPPPPTNKPFRIRTSTKSDFAPCKPNRINTIFPNRATLHQISPCNPCIYNTYKTRPA
jgi:hypothetical protein